MRILLLSTSMGMGGADKLLLGMSQELRSRGHEVLLVSMTSLGPMGLEAQSLGVPTQSLEMRRGFPDPRGLLRLARWVRTWRPDVVHSHMLHANLMARALRLLAPVPVLVSTIHSVYDGGPVWMAAYRLTNHMVDQMTAVSQAAFDRVVRERIVPRELLKVVPNAVDTALFADVPAELRQSLRRSLGITRQFVWVAVGRFETAKDYPNLLRAFAQVRARHSNAMLLLVGQGSLQVQTEAISQSLGLAEAVRFLGVRKDISQIMSAADAYVMSSAWEGMPIVLLEAAAAGLPIVATRVGGNHEVAREEDGAILVPAKDSDALGRGMLQLMQLTEGERRSSGRRAHDHVRRIYGLSRIADHWESLYREVLARKASGVTHSPSAWPKAP